ncbi:MAG: hypothetical protein AAB019_08315 [Planctomycetota bacterium]
MSDKMKDMPLANALMDSKADQMLIDIIKSRIEDKASPEIAQMNFQLWKDTINDIAKEILIKDGKCLPEQISEDEIYLTLLAMIGLRYVHREREVLKILNELREELRPRWLSWDALTERFSKLESSLTGVTASSRSLHLTFLKMVYDKAKAADVNDPTSPRLIRAEEVIAIAKSLDIRRTGGFYQRLLKTTGDGNWVLLTAEALNMLRIAGEIK